MSLRVRLVAFQLSLGFSLGCAGHRDAPCHSESPSANGAKPAPNTLTVDAPPVVAPARSVSAVGTAVRSPEPTKPAPAPEVIPLFPEGVPGRLTDAPPEREDATHVYHVDTPTLTLFRPAAAMNRGAAVIVCPGGGYVRLSVAKEGSAVTRFLNAHGITALVLKYHVEPYRYPAALRDVLRAVRLVRANAVSYGVDRARIGVFGSSAGGHLTLRPRRCSTHRTVRPAPPSTRPARVPTSWRCSTP